MELCTQLSYQGSLRPSKGVFFYEQADGTMVPLPIDHDAIVGQKCSYSEAYQPSGSAKNLQPQDLAFGNPVRRESCYVPPTIDTVMCRFSLRVEASSQTPFVCNNQNVAEALRRFSSAYRKVGGYEVLARRYCKNLLLGNWLWRNKRSLGLKIAVNTSRGSSFEIDNALLIDWHEPWPSEYEQALDGLTAELADALSGAQPFWFADVKAHVSASFMQEIFPSELFSDAKDGSNLSREYAKVRSGDGQLWPSLNAEKIGAAIQLIDDWWSDEADKRLRVHEYGGDKEYLIAHRMPASGIDAYSLLKTVDDKTALLESMQSAKEIPADIHYLMAVLVKGGLFQKSRSV
ncbi:type I-F CRISPR-associated protein Csy3 [Enterovibrio norvegicus]|uniref:type I-F CRISPR-associated protein Csy3 n=1 Tax=Enterovibrio norvegicus TaxID=188144 RepID=UPI0013D3D24C|nr:type I-F CRISPR-associated protein Csy3 [Enterovibrio norvegicus]